MNYSHRCRRAIAKCDASSIRRRTLRSRQKALSSRWCIRLVPRLGHAQAIGAIAHRLCRLIWKILHQGVRYEERGPEVSAKSKRRRATRMIKELKALGYRIEGEGLPASSPA